MPSPSPSPSSSPMPALTLSRPPPHQVRASTANAYPQSYYVGQQGRHLNLKQMCLWECTAVLHAGIIFFITFNAWGVVSSAGVGVGNAVGVGSATPHADGSDADMYTVRLLHTLLPPTAPTSPPTPPTSPTPTTPTTLTAPTTHLLHLLHLLLLTTGGCGGQLHGSRHGQPQAPPLHELAHEAHALSRP